MPFGWELVVDATGNGRAIPGGLERAGLAAAYDVVHPLLAPGRADLDLGAVAAGPGVDGQGTDVEYQVPAGVGCGAVHRP